MNDEDDEDDDERKVGNEAFKVDRAKLIQLTRPSETWLCRWSEADTTFASRVYLSFFTEKIFSSSPMVRQLKHHEQKLLKKVDFLNASVWFFSFLLFLVEWLSVETGCQSP